MIARNVPAKISENILIRCTSAQIATAFVEKSDADIYCRLAAQNDVVGFLYGVPVRCRLSIYSNLCANVASASVSVSCPYPKCHQALKLMSFRANGAAKKKKSKNFAAER